MSLSIRLLRLGCVGALAAMMALGCADTTPPPAADAAADSGAGEDGDVPEDGEVDDAEVPADGGEDAST
jgi:hypothetical protein